MSRYNYNHKLTGKTRHRDKAFSSCLVLQVEETYTVSSTSYCRFTCMTESTPSDGTTEIIWRDATIVDLQLLHIQTRVKTDCPTMKTGGE